MALQIPKDTLQAIGKILHLTDGEIDVLINALASTTITAEASEMADQIGETVPTIPRDDLADILETLYSLYHVREFSEVRHPRFIRDLVDAILQHPELGLKRDDASSIGKRFQRLLNVKTLNVLSKAVRLQRDAGHLYCDAKILSDVRPVFGDDVETGPISAVITHTLKLGYHEGGDHREFFIVLDQQDLITLLEVLERAQKKEKALTGVLERLGLPRLGV